MTHKTHAALGRALALVAAVLCAAPAAAVPTAMTYAGVLEDSGVPVNATVNATFKLFSAETLGNELYTEDDNGLVVLDGELVVELGKNNLDDALLDSPELWLEVTVDGDVLDPRVRLTSVPYALHASRAAVADALGALAENDVVTQQQLITLNLDHPLSAGSGITISNGVVAVSSISTAQIGDAQVTLAKLAPSSVDGSKIVDGSVALADLGANAVDSSKIVDGSVALADLKTSSVDSSKIVDGTIVNADVSTTAAISGSKLANDSVTGAQIGASAVTASELASGAVTSAKLLNSKHLFQVTAPGCVETVGLLDTANTCTRDTAGCTAGQCRDCNTNVCGSANCALTFCFNTDIGFVVGP